MAFIDSGFRRVLLAREVGIVLAPSQGRYSFGATFLPAYLTGLLASGVRNNYLPWLGDGVLFWAVTLMGLNIQAVVVTTSYLAFETIVDSLRGTSANDSSA